jgi:hypothetical protein
VETRLATSSSDIGREILEISWGVSKREAAVSSAVFMPALEILARVAEKKRPWRHQLATPCGPILKASRRNDCDGDMRVPLFERAILRTGSTDHILDRPTIALGQHARCGLARGTVHSAPRQSAL